MCLLRTWILDTFIPWLSEFFSLQLIWWICTRLSKRFCTLSLLAKQLPVSMAKLMWPKKRFKKFTLLEWSNCCGSLGKLPAQDYLRARHWPPESHPEGAVNGSPLLCLAAGEGYLILWGIYFSVIDSSLSSSMYWQWH